MKQAIRWIGETVRPGIIGHPFVDDGRERSTRAGVRNSDSVYDVAEAIARVIQALEY